MNFRDMMLPAYLTPGFKKFCYVDPEPAPEPSADPAPEPEPTPAPEPDGNVLSMDNWREHFSGGDEKIAEELGRYAEPGLVGAALVEAKNKIRSNTAKEPLADNATDEEVTTWRTDNGIPAEAGGYLEGLPEGLVVSETDKPGMDALAAAMHKVNASPAAFHAAMGSYYQSIEEAKAFQVDSDVLAQKDSDDALHEAYGTEMRRNVNDLNKWLGAAGGEIKEAVLGSRMADGSPLGSNPEYVKWMVSQMRRINPLVTVPGLGGGDPAVSIENEIADIEKVMQNDNRAYQADKPMQARLLELYKAQEKSANKTAASP